MIIMKRKLFTQIKNEWRSNLWLGIELLVVSTALWYIFDNFVVVWQQLHMPNSYNTENCFYIELATESHDGIPGDNETRCNEVQTIVKRLRDYPGVQYASLVAHTGSVPHMQSMWNGNLCDVEADSLSFMVAYHFVDPEFFKVLRIPGVDGETPEEMSEKFRYGSIFLSDNVPYKYRMNDNDELTWDYEMWEKYLNSSARELMGRRYKLPGDSITRVVTGIIKPFKRMNFEEPQEAVIVASKPEELYDADNILVRVFPEAVADFKDRVTADSQSMFTVGNRFVRNVTSFDDLQKSVEANYWKELYYYIFMMVFLLMSIYLGLLGAFWFRTQQRVSEIAIRKVNGATNRQIFGRLISEGFLILILATPLSLVLDWLMTRYQLNSAFPGYLYFVPLRFALAALFSFLSLALMITLGIWFPARKAMQVDPALAIKDE